MEEAAVCRQRVVGSETHLDNVLNVIEPMLLEASSAISSERQVEMGQFLTPPSVASFMASFLEFGDPSIRLLDPGAGAGTLTAAVVQAAKESEHGPQRLEATAYELDDSLEPRLRSVLRFCQESCKQAGITFNGEALQEDFIQIGVAALAGDMFVPGSPLLESFDCAILNPPYRKLNNGSTERKALQSLGLDVGNLYTAFLALAVEFLKPGGELVSITPRSFCNGPYFRPFRMRFLEKMSLRRIHVFDKRDLLFGEDSVLQENVIVYAVKEPVAPESRVVVSSSADPDEESLLSERRYEEVVVPGDPEAFIRVVPDEWGSRTGDRMAALGNTLKDLEITVSTGRVVDFRVRELLRWEADGDTVPLIYPHNLQDGFVEWPREHAKKHSAMLHAPKSEKSLVPSGVYVLVKRFSAKEERRRVTAAIYDPARLNGDTALRNESVGFENHLNFYHCGGAGLSRTLARALAAFLSSTFVDLYFRQFSGHTQVNATDLRNLRYPSREALEQMGTEIEETFGDESPDRKWIDNYVGRRLLDVTDGAGDPSTAQTKIEEAKEVLKALGMPRAQQNDRSALTLLALLGLGPGTPWSQAADPLLGITEMMDYFAEHYGKRYAPNSRETVRRQSVHQFQDAGIVVQNPDDPTRPTNSGNNRYQIDGMTLDLLRLYGAPDWSDALETWLSNITTLRERYAQERKMDRIPLKLPSGKTIALSPGGQNELVKEIIDEFCPNYTPGGVPIYIGDTDEKWLYFEEDELRKLGVEIEEHGKMPDLVVHDVRRGWLVLIEAVTSHGPIDYKRKEELERLFSGSTMGLVLVTTFLNRKTLAKYLDKIAWETEVWVADAPEHMIHLNGIRYLGPYDEGGPSET